MSASTVTVSDLLGVRAANVQEAVTAHVKAQATDGGVASEVMGFVAEETARAITERLDVDVFELVFKAWAAVTELREYADPAKHPPHERAVVRWGRCDIRAPQAIDVKLTVAGLALPVLRFTVDLAAEFESLALTIQGGTIRKLAPGTASASVALRYGSATLIEPCSTPPLTFERGIEFPEGLPIV